MGGLFKTGIVLFFMGCCINTSISARASHVVLSFEDATADNTTVNNHLVVHKDTGVLYVGAVNRIYQLDPNLRLMAWNKTGPANDSTECSSDKECSDMVVKVLTNNVNKALVIDYSRAKLISCGSIYQGACWILGLDNVSTTEQFVSEPIVANNESASTVAFIAPGPPSPPTSTVLYVGVTFTGNSAYRAEVPAVCSRSLHPSDHFSIAAQGVSSGTKMNVNNREHYPINYIYGFSSEGFSYFLTTQKKDTSSDSEFISKLVRICQRDSNYYSYTEIPIQCMSEVGNPFSLVQAAFIGKPGPDLANKLDIAIRDDVLFAVFARADPIGSAIPGNESALCVYSMKNIRRKFVENIQECMEGKVFRGLPFIAPSVNCVKTQVKIIEEDFCGMDVNTPFGGEKPVISMSVLNFTTLLTSVAATSAGNYTVVFLGTRDGHLKKVVVESEKSGSEYDDIIIDDSKRVNQDMFFDQQQTHLYVMTERRISKVLVHNCSEYTSCNSCVEAGDPYCGWCSLQNKCTLKSNCHKGSKSKDHALYWISYKSGQCTRITFVSPNQLQSSTARTLHVNIEHLPTRSGEFSCVFRFANGKTLQTNANYSNNGGGGVTCYTPPTSELPPIPPGKHNFTATLSVRMVQDGTPPNDFVATEFTFFDCNTYTTCTSCVTSAFPCDWCVDKHRCTHDTAENCRNDILVTGLNRVGPSMRGGPSFCPRINVTNGSPEILVPFGTEKQIQVKTENIAQQIIVQTRFSCRFNIEGRVVPVLAQLIDNTIYCESILFNYNSQAPNITVPFAVVLGGGETKSLDNPADIHIKVYRCPVMADNCGMCLAMDEKYNCGWCQSSQRCQVQEQCDNGRGVWLNRNQNCPNPEIRNFEPKSGPWEGGTNVTIDGINLGKKFDDIYTGVTVAGVQCQPYSHLYEQTRRIVCKLDGPGQNDFKTGPIIVKVAGYRAQSLQNYRFVDPKIKSISPNRGPKSGGTRVNVYGDHLNAGSSIQAFINDIPCEILSKEINRITCRTGRSDSIMRGRLVVKFDKTERKYEHGFTYVEDPLIMERDRPLRGIPGGGINITVEGRNFDVVQEPFIYVLYNGTSYNGTCSIANNETMYCLTPKLDVEPYFNEADARDGMRLQYGFILDTVNTTMQHLSEEKLFHLFPNPHYDQFEEKVKKYKSDYLTINGRNLNSGSDESDIMVLIGSSVCNVTSLSRNQLTCKPPMHQPPNINEDGIEDGSKPPAVIVKVGKNLMYEIGRLRYDHVSPVELPQKIMYIMIAGAVVLLIVFVIILIAYRRKSTENNRVLKNMQEQMDVLELRVAAECKEAFAELQTEMTDLTGDVTACGIPYLDYRNYAMKILFPNGEDHGVLQLDRPEIMYRAKGLRHFGSLVLNKTFLLLFIRTLENNRYFSMRDRVNVASLIMVSLQGKMEYCTDILKTLLAELIEKSMESKNHPKLLLRRTESVAEKMLSAWFTFLLYKFLKECAGEPLYMLYRAIKQQVDKGPVDAVTAEARYSLSEEKLIRQSIGYKPITVFVSMSHQTTYMTGLDLNQENTDVPVKVLDCDTITQVKEKALDTIYRATPYSQRPRKEDLDLEWRTGNKGRLILYDEDSTTKTEGEWKKLNTLSHYRVPDAACLTLVPKQSSMYNLSILSERSEKSHKYETLNLSKYNSASPPMSRATSPLNHDREGGMKNLFMNSTQPWHLVKHHDSDNQKEGERGNKMVSEIYLTRLLATKLTLQKFVDDLFETIFSTSQRGSSLPLAIKYMFDFLDDQALQHGITDPEVVHTWKSNSLPLRFWVNLIKNPNFVYDIHKSNIVDSCLSVVAQTFMDACSTSEHRLGKDSPSSKLLYAKDIPSYKEWVEHYYANIKAMPCISDQDMNSMLAEESRLHASEFSTESALMELYNYAVKYNDQLLMTLEEDEFSQKQRLAYKLEQVHNIMASEGH